MHENTQLIGKETLIQENNSSREYMFAGCKQEIKWLKQN